MKNKYSAFIYASYGILAFVSAGVLLSAGITDPVGAELRADRAALADKFLQPSLDRLLTNMDVQPRFTEDGAGLLYWLGATGQHELRLFDLASRRSQTLLKEEALVAQLAALLHRPVGADRLVPHILDYRQAERALLFYADGRRWRRNADGALLEVRVNHPVSGPDALSPDGRFEIIARDFNLFARNRATDQTVALTTDGTREQPYGRSIPELADILKAGTEEPDMPVSVRWSPDSRRILSWRLDSRNVPKLSVTQQNPPGSLYPRSFQYIYPLAGSRHLPQATRLVIDVDQAFRTGKGRIVTLAVPPEDILYPQPPGFDWVDGMPQMVWTQRGYGEIRVYRADPETGAAQIIARESVKPLVTVTSSFFQLAPGLGGLLNVSERSGWAQLYFVRPDDPDGGIALTRGKWEVISIDHIDAEQRTILVTGVGREADRNPYDRALYRVGLDGAPPVLLTPELLDHDVTISRDGAWLVDAMSSPTVPTRTVLRRAADGKIIAELARGDPSALRAAGYILPERFKGVAADGHTPLYGMIWRPVGFDPKRRYPIIDEVYTGPTTTQVPVSWNASVTARAGSVAQIGAVVVNIDGRGTSRRGQAFRLPAYQNLGEVGLDDHIAMIRQMAARYPALDTSRVGVYGGSAGGYDAARFILRRPGFFKVAVASSGNHDLRLDKAWWPEVSMGLADDAVWERNSNMSVASNLQGKLLLIHGDIDDNVPVTESYRLAKAVIDAGHDVDLVILPNTTHAVAQPFFWRKLRNYFYDHLIGDRK